MNQPTTIIAIVKKRSKAATSQLPEEIHHHEEYCTTLYFSSLCHDRDGYNPLLRCRERSGTGNLETDGYM